MQVEVPDLAPAGRVSARSRSTSKHETEYLQLLRLEGEMSQIDIDLNKLNQIRPLSGLSVLAVENTIPPV